MYVLSVCYLDSVVGIFRVNVRALFNYGRCLVIAENAKKDDGLELGLVQTKLGWVGKNKTQGQSEKKKFTPMYNSKQKVQQSLKIGYTIGIWWYSLSH